jgi:hypothetical protein
MTKYRHSKHCVKESFSRGGGILRRASISKDSNLCVKIARRGNAKGILALYIIFIFLSEYQPSHNDKNNVEN